MKLRKSTPFRSHSSIATVFSVALFTHLAVFPASAATRNWVGGYAATGVWSQTTQWAEGIEPVTGDDIVFNNIAGSNTGTSINEARTVKSITFNGGSPSPAFTIRLANNNSSTAHNLTFQAGNTGITVAAANTASHTIGMTGTSIGNVVLAGSLGVLHNGSGTLTINRPITDGATPYGVTKSGPGLLVLSAVNTYDGQSIVNGGKLRTTVGGSSANSEVVINDVAATFSVNVSDNTKSWTGNAFTPAAAGTLEFNFGAITPSTTVSPLLVTNAADFSAASPPVSVLVNSPGLLPGTYPLMTWGSTSGTAPSVVNVSNVQAGTLPSLSLSGDGLTLNLVITSTAPAIVKANNALALNDGNSWVGGLAPAPTEVAKWNSTVESANTTVLGADTTWAGIAIENPTGLVTINGPNTLTLGAAASDIDMSAATADLTLNGPLTLGAANTWNVAASQTLTLGGQVSGAFGVTKQGDGTTLLSSTANDYTGNTTVTAGTLKLGASQVIPDGAAAGNVAVAATLDLNGNNETVNGLSGAGIIDNLAASTTSTLTAGANNQTSTFSGILQNTGTTATLNLIKTGSGTLTLPSANTLSGSVTVNGGTLAVSNTTPLANASGITLAGSTTLTSQTTGITITPPVTLGGPSATISFGRSTADPGTFTLNGGISGTGSLVLTTPNVNSGGNLQTIVLDAAGTYNGATTLTTGNIGNAVTVRAGVEDTLPTTTVLAIDGGNGSGSGRTLTFDLAGNNQMLAGLNNNISTLTARNQRVTNSGAAATLTINNSVDCTYGGAGISSTFNGNPVNPTAQITGAITLAKSGAGTFTLLGSNSYTGATTITGGTLNLGGANNALPNASPVSIGAATLAKSTAGTETAGTLEVTGAATINLATGANLAFATGSPAWSGALTIKGAFVSGVSLKFGEDINGLTPAQIAAISGPGLSNIGINSTGFITATVASGGYAAWAATNAGGQGSELDFDNDGVTNGVEFFLNAAPGFTANPALGGLNAITWTNGGNIPASAYGTQFVVQTSGNLATWTDVLVGDLTTNTDGPGGSLTYTLSGTAPRFVRLKVLPD